MPVEHIPMYGANDEPLEVYEEGSFPENVTVPLVIYVGGERKVVGEATINKGQVSVVLGDDVAEEVVGLVVGRPDEAQFSFGFSKYPDPYREPYIDLSMIRGKFGRPVEDEPPRDCDIDNPIPLPPYKKRFFDKLPSKERTEYRIPAEKYDEAFPLLLEPRSKKDPIIEAITSTKIYGEHSLVEGCTCPWNNGYIKPGSDFPHHITCPALTGTHTADDQCRHAMGHFCKEK